MTAISAFLPYVEPYATGCPEPVAKRAIVEALNTFLQDTWYYQVRMNAQRILSTDTVVGTFTDQFNTITVNGNARYPVAKTNSEQYVIEAPTGTRPYQIIDVQAGDTMLMPLASATVNEAPNWSTKTGDSQYFTRQPASVAEIFPTPETPDDLILLVAFTVLYNATEIPAGLFEDHRNPIIAKALSILYMQPSQPYSNPAMAVEEARQYHHGMNEAKIRINKGHTRADVQVRPRYWA